MEMIYLIILHGSGGSGLEIKSFLDCVPLKSHGYRTFRDIANGFRITYDAPTASEKPYTAAFGTRMNIWFDRSDNWNALGTDDPHEDIYGIEESIEKILTLVQNVPPEFEHIIIGGHSMGGGLCLHLLRKSLPERVRGIFSIGSFAVKSSALFAGPLGNAAKLPLLMMHGTSDPLIRHKWGQDTATSLLIKGVDVEFRSYHGLDHGLDDSQLTDLLEWIPRLVSAASRPSNPTTTTTTNHQNTPPVPPSNTVPYSLESVESEDGSSRYRVTYPVPRDM